jgi:hypothetical protein
MSHRIVVPLGAACWIFALLTASAAQAAIPVNPLMWVRADQGAEEAAGDPAENGDPVNVWQDQSANNHDLTPSTVFFNAPPSVAAPTYLDNQINGKPALSFALPNNSLQSDHPLLTGPSSMNFTVISVVKVAASGERVMGGNYGATNGGGIELTTVAAPRAASARTTTAPRASKATGI